MLSERQARKIMRDTEHQLALARAEVLADAYGAARRKLSAHVATCRRCLQRDGKLTNTPAGCEGGWHLAAAAAKAHDEWAQADGQFDDRVAARDGQGE